MSMDKTTTRRCAAWVLCIGLSVAGSATRVRADDLLGAYVGVGAGQSFLNNNYHDFGYYGGYHDNNVAWKVMAGLRPLPILGAEIEYLDFGRGRGDVGLFGNNGYFSNENSHPRATAAFALGYLPLPLPFLDVYGKLGVARLQSSLATYYTPPSGGCNGPAGFCSAPPASHITDETNTRPAYGAGIQAKWQDFAFRAEYERISSQFGDPSAITFGLTWTF